MELFKRDIWKLYYTIVFLSLIFVFLISYGLWIQKVRGFTQKQETYDQATAYYIENLFSQYETILDLIGKNILNGNIVDKRDAAVLNQILALNPTLGGIAVFRSDGEAYVVSSNIDKKKLPNLLTDAQTREGFLRALKSDKMVIDRTYFVTAIDSLVIPIRKAVRDRNGTVVAVVTSGILLNDHSGFVNALLGNNKIFILRDKDRFYQFYNFDPDVYAKALPKRLLRQTLQTIEQTYGMSIERVKNSQRVVTIECRSYIEQKPSLSSYRYIKRYALWIIATTPMEIIWQEFVREESVLLPIYIVIMLIIYYLIRIIDKNELQKQKTLKEQAIKDSLTGLYNRLYIEEKIKNYSHEYTLFFIDLDGFKSINDSFGHEYGDKVLQVIARRLESFDPQLQKEIIRYSGDEFICVSDFLSDAAIKDVAMRILKTIAKEFTINDFRFVLGASIGIARYPYDGHSFDEVKRYADLAMYKAKEMKNSFVIFHKKLKEEYEKNATIERELKMALERNEFSVVYHPQVYIDGEIHGVEALVRWENERLGKVPPADFIPLAESTGMIKEIGRFIITRVLEEVEAMAQECDFDFKVSINISAKQFSQSDFLSCVVGKIAASSIAKERIVLEITETAFIDDKTYVIELLRQIKRQGIEISLDDFGTGYSSMNILRNLPIDELKIDKSFIDDIVHDTDTRQIVYSIIIIAKSLSLKVVAEGVEQLEQKEILDDFGCDIYQGFLFAKPMDKDALIALLRAQNGVLAPTCWL